jgi:nicotinamidase-related amidase
LIEALPEGRQHIVIGGCEAHVCMLQTALSLLDAGYKVWVVADATGSRRESDRDIALDRLRQSGARIVTTEMVAFEWMIHCNHPRFREVQALIK